MSDDVVSGWDELEQIEMTAAQLALILRCSEQAVRAYARAGIVKRSARGTYKVIESVGAVAEHLRQVSVNTTLVDAMRISVGLKQANQRLAEARIARLDAQLIARPDAEALWNDLAASAKNLFLSLPDRARAELPGLTETDMAALRTLAQQMFSECPFAGPIQWAEPDDGDDDNGEAE